MQQFNKNGVNKTQGNRINHQIRVPQVRVVQEGRQLGVMPTFQALRLAQDEGLDLVEIAPTSRPPVCHILDYGKYRFDESVRQKMSKKKQKLNAIQDKEIRLSSVITPHDIETKATQAKGFLAEGKIVQFTLKFYGRHIAHSELGFDVMDTIVSMLQEVANVDTMPRMEGKTISCRLSPKKNKDK